jgi:ABC-type polysaccharide/polyol phosphate transport system ATPase subunit
MRSEFEHDESGGNAGPVAVTATGLGKRFRLGEHQSLQLTVRRMTRGSEEVEGPALDALSGVNFRIRRGESVGIVGTNGSGKSTLLQILSGTTLPTTGTMHVHGRVLPLLAVGTGFHPELTGRENVKLFAYSLGFPRKITDSRIAAVSEFAELTSHMDTPLKRFSTGMSARLSFAIAMQFPADIYVFDEVLAVVDGEFQSRCIAEIRRLHSEGRTVIFVSHSLLQVEEVCERVMWLNRGRLERLGPTRPVLSSYSRSLGGDRPE